jgi:hypothetical protein
MDQGEIDVIEFARHKTHSNEFFSESYRNYRELLTKLTAQCDHKWPDGLYAGAFDDFFVCKICGRLAGNIY